MTIPDFSDLIGLPFAFNARGPNAYDCWGLVMEAYRRWHGLEIPDYRTPTECRNVISEIMNDAAKDGFWASMEKPKPGAVLLLSVRGFGSHAGFMLPGGRFIHSAHSTHSVRIERLERVWRLLGVYHHV
jgi:cell wall-associated NlpC family hydrolase